MDQVGPQHTHLKRKSLHLSCVGSNFRRLGSSWPSRSCSPTPWPSRRTASRPTLAPTRARSSGILCRFNQIVADYVNTTEFSHGCFDLYEYVFFLDGKCDHPSMDSGGLQENLVVSNIVCRPDFASAWRKSGRIGKEFELRKSKTLLHAYHRRHSVESSLAPSQLH